jgi:hypothetical protein
MIGGTHSRCIRKKQKNHIFDRIIAQIMLSASPQASKPVKLSSSPEKQQQKLDNSNSTPTQSSSTESSSETSSAVDIKGRSSSFNAPTPANTPLNSAPIASKQFKTNLKSMSENPSEQQQQQQGSKQMITGGSSVSQILQQNPQILSALQVSLIFPFSLFSLFHITHNMCVLIMN